jgi:hypothetical protein
MRRGCGSRFGIGAKGLEHEVAKATKHAKHEASAFRRTLRVRANLCAGWWFAAARVSTTCGLACRRPTFVGFVSLRGFVLQTRSLQDAAAALGDDLPAERVEVVEEGFFDEEVFGHGQESGVRKIEAMMPGFRSPDSSMSVPHRGGVCGLCHTQP